MKHNGLLNIERGHLSGTPTEYTPNRWESIVFQALDGRPLTNACASSHVGSTPAARASSNVGAAASRSEITSSCPLGQSMANAGSVAAMVCSRCGLYSAEHSYITVELSCSATKPCP